MLKILIDARPLRSDLSGVGQYVLHLGLALHRRLDVDTRLMAFDFLRRSNALLQTPAIAALDGVVWRRTVLHRKVFNAIAAYAPEPIATRTMPGAVDVLHGTYFERLPPAGRAARVSTIHDVAFLRHPHFFSGSNLAASRRALRQQIETSDLLLAVSEFTRNELVNLCDVDPERVRVTPLAPTQLVPVKKTPTPLRHRPYFLFVGNLEPRKNLPRCLLAWERSGLHTDFDLVVAGSRLRSQADHDLRLDGLNGVVPVGYVDADTKWRLLRQAAGFLWPSLYEGFGLPVLEAMTAGVPVVTSRGSAMEELTGDLAWLVDPEDVDAIASALRQIAEDVGAARSRGRLGIQRAAHFNWAETAQRTADAYFAAASRVGGEAEN